MNHRAEHKRCGRLDLHPVHEWRGRKWSHWMPDGVAQCAPCYNGTRVGVCDEPDCQCGCRYPMWVDYWCSGHTITEGGWNR